MTQHPTDPGLIAQGGSETAGTDILDRARRVLGGKATPSASLCMELVVEVERLRGALDRAESLAEQWKQAAVEKGWRKHTFADELRAVLRGDQ